MESLQLIDLRREIKVEIKNDIVKDAGGLMREWIYLTTNQIINDKDRRYFKKANTKEIIYSI